MRVEEKESSTLVFKKHAEEDSLVRGSTEAR